MAFVATYFKVTENELRDRLANAGDHVTWVDLIMIDYVYHHEDANYQGGLSFLDRIYKKLGKFHKNDWPPIDYVKKTIGDSIDYGNWVNHLLKDPSDVLYYGV